MVPAAVEIWIRVAEKCKEEAPPNLPPAGGEKLGKCSCYICLESRLRLAYFQLFEKIHRSSSPFNCKTYIESEILNIKEPVPVYREGIKGGLRNIILK